MLQNVGVATLANGHLALAEGHINVVVLVLLGNDAEVVQVVHQEAIDDQGNTGEQ